MRNLIVSATMSTMLLAAASAYAGDSSCEGFNLTFKNNLPVGAKVVNASLSGAQMDPAEFSQLNKGVNQTFELKFVSSENIVGHFEFETQDKVKKHFNVDFNLADALAHCSHVDHSNSEKNGIQISSSRNIGGVTYSFGK